MTNQAVIDPTNAIAESDETNNSSQTVTTTVRSRINLKLTKSPGSQGASQNSKFDYVIKVTNEDLDGSGGATAFGVKIVDPLPIGLIPLSITAEPGNFNCDIQENPVNVATCIGDLNSGDSVTVTINVFVTADGGTLDNEGCVDPDNTIVEQKETDNCQHAISAVTPPIPDLLISKSASSGTVTAGQDLTYTLLVSNGGGGATTGTVTVTDTLPAEVDFREHDDDQRLQLHQLVRHRDLRVVGRVGSRPVHQHPDPDEGQDGDDAAGFVRQHRHRQHGRG